MTALCDCLIPHALQRRSRGIDILLQQGHLLFWPALELLSVLCTFMLPAHAPHPMMPCHTFPWKAFLCEIRITWPSQHCGLAYVLCRPALPPAGHSWLCTAAVQVTHRMCAATGCGERLIAWPPLTHAADHIHALPCFNWLPDAPGMPGSMVAPPLFWASSMHHAVSGVLTGLLCGVGPVSTAVTLLRSWWRCTARHCWPPPALRGMHLHMHTHALDAVPSILRLCCMSSRGVSMPIKHDSEGGSGEVRMPCAWQPWHRRQQQATWRWWRVDCLRCSGGGTTCSPGGTHACCCLNEWVRATGHGGYHWVEASLSSGPACCSSWSDSASA